MRYAFVALLAILSFGAVGDEITLEKAPVTWCEKDYNPIWNEKMWFQVNWKDSPNLTNKEWNVFVHPDHLKVELAKDLKDMALSASGKSTGNIYWNKLEANAATLYVATEDDRAKWEKRLQHLRDGLRRGFAGMSYEKIEEWNGGRVYVTVRDLFWNAGDPMMILVSRDKISVAVDSKIGRDQRYVEAKGAKVFYKGNSQNPTARLEAESVTISVWSEEEARKLKEQISKLPDE